MVACRSSYRCALLAIVASLAAPLGVASAQAIAHRNIMSMLISAAEDSSPSRAPALLERLGITASQRQQIRTLAAQHRLQRAPVIEQMRSAQAVSNSGGDGGNAILLQTLQGLDQAQEAAIETILTPAQLRSLRQLAPSGTVVISRSLAGPDLP